jgi:hypothetical protein
MVVVCVCTHTNTPDRPIKRVNAASGASRAASNRSLYAVCKKGFNPRALELRPGSSAIYLCVRLSCARDCMRMVVSASRFPGLN